MKIVIDGILSQVAATHADDWIGRLRVFVAECASRDWSVTILDRGNTPDIAQASMLSFPNYHATEGTADSILLQKTCDWLQADVFLSSALTSPTATPTLQLVVPGSLRSTLSVPARDTIEQRLALAFSSLIVCESEELADEVRSMGGSEVELEIVTPASGAESDGKEVADAAVTFAKTVASGIQRAVDRGRSAGDQAFRRKWRQVREMQAAVDLISVPE